MSTQNRRFNDSRKVVIRSGKQTIGTCLDALDLESRLKGLRNVFVKANLRAAAVPDFVGGSITNIDVVEELIAYLRSFGLSVTIGECTSSRIITEKALSQSGILRLAGKARIVNLNDDPVVRISVDDQKLRYLDFPKSVIETDFLISLPVMKTHSITKITLALKNMMGATSEFTPVRIHLKGLDHSIATINKTKPPDLSIIDATVAMEGTGPNLGTSIELNTIIAGYDPVAVDAVGTRMMGFDPHLIGHIVCAEKYGIGKMEPQILDGELVISHFKPSRSGFLSNLNDTRLFNTMMSIRPVHRFFYGPGYMFTKRVLRFVNPADSAG